MIFASSDNYFIASSNTNPSSWKYTSDGGTTWDTLNTYGNFYSHQLCYVPNTTNMFVGSDNGTGFRGVGFSYDGGLNWSDFTDTTYIQPGGSNIQCYGIGFCNSGLTATASANQINICTGNSTKLDVTPSGGASFGWVGNKTSPFTINSILKYSSLYTYSWTSYPAGFTSVEKNPVITPTVTTTYTVIVTSGANSVTASVVITVNPSPAPTITTVGQVNVSCYGGNNGTVHAIAGGGTSPYSYSWNTFPVQSTATAANLSAGNYTVSVIDANGCTDTNTVMITQPMPLVVSINTANADCGINNGSVTANVSGGTTSYSYLWSTTPVQTTQSATNLYTGNYTVTVTDAKGCTAHATAAIGVIPANFNLSFNTSPHSGNAPLSVTFENTTSNPGNYNFSWYYGDGSSTNDNSTYVYYNYNFAGLYNVALLATNIANGCTDTLVLSHDVNVSGTGCTHTVSITPSGTINKCDGDTVILTLNTTAVAPYTIQWNIGSVVISGAVSNTLAVTQSGYFSVTVIKNNCPVTSSSVQINFAPSPQKPQISAIGSIIPCVGGSVTLTALPNYTSYLWNTGATTQSINDSLSGTFTVEGFNMSGCGSISDSYSVNASLLQSPEICIVTVDTTSTKNFIIWEKPLVTDIVSFKIYRETSSIFTHIATIPYTSTSIFTDTTNGINPNTTAYKYKISAVDTCGTESALSSFHRSIHVSISPASPCGYNLIWNDYIGFPVTQYLIYRDSSNTGLVKKDSVSFGNTSWTDFTCYSANDTIAYLIEAVNSAGCNPSKSGGHNSTRSNVQRNYSVSVPLISGNNMNIKIFPNPANSNICIESENELKDAEITIYNIHSQIMLQMPLQKKITELDISKLVKGVYVIKILSEKGIAVKKLVKD
jgi:hypothetical protein